MRGAKQNKEGKSEQGELADVGHPQRGRHNQACRLDFAGAAGMVTPELLHHGPQPMPTDLPKIPIARRVAHSVTHHGATVEDPYAWLRDPGYPQVNDPDVLGYLRAENS
jgi:hypothetical protein